MPAININMYIPPTNHPVPLKSYNYLSVNPTFLPLTKDSSGLTTNSYANDPYYFITDSNFQWNGNGAVLIPSGNINVWFQFYSNSNIWQDVTSNWTVVNDSQLITNGGSFILTGSTIVDGVTYDVYSFYESNQRGTITTGALQLSFDIV